MKSTISSAVRFAKSKWFWAGTILLCFACVGFIGAQTNAVSPFGGVGNVQFFDNNGSPLLGGVLYTYQAGTTTQQASYTDSTGSILNPNPVPLSSGGRASIWLLTGNFYKLVLCSQNDGASCAPGDTLFSVDQVPGGASSSGGSSSSPFISGSANPATSGILRLASGDTVCWRNAGGSANLCWSKDANDLLSWSGGSIKFPEVSAPAGVATFDVLWADATAHRWMMSNNGGVAAQVVASGVDINTSDQVTQLHFGSTPFPMSTTAPSTNQVLHWNGTNVDGIPSAKVECVNVTPVTVSNTAVNTPLQSCTLPANEIGVGQSFYVVVEFIAHHQATDSVVLTLNIGSTSQGAFSLTPGTLVFEFTSRFHFTGITAGTSGTYWWGTPELLSNELASGIQVGGGSTAATTLNTTISNVVNLSAQWSNASASDVITSETMEIYRIN